MNMTFRLDFKKETDGTFVYATKDPRAASRSIYVSKLAVEEGAQPPAAFEVTLKPIAG